MAVVVFDCGSGVSGCSVYHEVPLSCFLRNEVHCQLPLRNGGLQHVPFPGSSALSMSVTSELKDDCTEIHSSPQPGIWTMADECGNFRHDAKAKQAWKSMLPYYYVGRKCTQNT
eukprot:1366578-Amphidinium_carterae.1